MRSYLDWNTASETELVVELESLSLNEFGLDSVRVMMWPKSERPPFAVMRFNKMHIEYKERMDQQNLLWRVEHDVLDALQSASYKMAGWKKAG